jgi:molybdenum-dependent DNA-binding transcriptional regulator ModE
MARKYIPDPRSKRHRHHDQNEIQDTLTIIEQGSSIRSAAKSTGIPYSVLQRYNRKNK